MKQKKQSKSLFDRLQTEITHETTIEQAYCKIPEDGLVYYMSNRTGREATMSAGRYYAISSLSSGLRKRYVGPTAGPCVSDTERRHLAVLEFLEDNERCRLFNETYHSSKLSDLASIIRGEVRVLLDDVFNGTQGLELSCSTLGHELVSGPGASADVQGDAGSYGRLANSNMSFSSPMVKRVYKTLSSTTRLSFLSESVREALYGVADSVDTHAHFLSVLKTNEKNRGICTQPSGNMALQLSTHGWLTKLLKRRFDCDLEVQQFLNRELARLGSKQRVHGERCTWSWCTWDLSRASNFPWALVQDLAPDNVSSWLDLIRSHYMDISYPSGLTESVEKHMCSTMGNGFTFALMTMILSAIVKCCYLYMNIPEYDSVGKRFIKTWGVYGDDIIADRRLRFILPLVLGEFGFIINTKKSFTSGPFRESCGGDFWDGYNVRPVFIESLDTLSDIYSLMNRLNEWSVHHSFPLVRSIHILRDAAALMQPNEFRVPNYEDVSSGIRVPFNLSLSPEHNLRSRNVAPSKEMQDYAKEFGGRLYCALTPEAKRRSVFFEKTKEASYTDIQTRAVVRYSYVSDIKWNDRHPNVCGILLHMLGGTIRKGQYGLRPLGSTHMVETWRYAPSWGHHVPLSGITDVPLRREYADAEYRFWAELTTKNYSRKTNCLELRHHLASACEGRSGAVAA